MSDARTPGQLIKELLDQRGWTQKVLAVVLGVDETTIGKLVNGKKTIDAEWALLMGEVFGIPAERFLDLQKRMELEIARLKARPDPGRTRRAHLFGGLPVAEMIRRGWISVENPKDVRAIEAALATFFGVASSEEIEVLPHAAKKTNVVGEVTPPQLAWLRRARAIASEMIVMPYRPSSVGDALGRLKPLLVSAEAARKVPRVMAEAGIRFLIVEALPSAKIDGVCLWLDDASPVVAMTLRHDRIDNFWFVLRHELEHVRLGHGRTAVRLDTELDGSRAGVGDDVPEEERLANAAAAEFCVPQASLRGFISRKEPFFAERDLLGFATTMGVHPGLVAGQLQHKTGRYERFRQHQVKIRASVSPGSMVDGWGDVAPTGM